MSSGRNNRNSPFVYSTDPNFSYDNGQEEEISLPPSEQVLKVILDTRHRKGKTVTLVEGFVGKEEDREYLGKKLRTSCGTGGSVKDDQIIVQGSHVEKVKELLKAWGYRIR